MKVHPDGTYSERYIYPVNFLKDAHPPDHPEIIVTIPCYAEENLVDSLKSLYNCHDPGCNAEVIVVINHPENSPENIVRQNESSWSDATQFINQNNKPWLKYHLIRAYDLPEKSAGVGLARKIGMDEAVRRFHLTKNRAGII